MSPKRRDKTLLDLFVLLNSSDESHLLWPTAREAYIKEEPDADKSLFLHDEQNAGPLVETMKLKFQGKQSKFKQKKTHK